MKDPFPFFFPFIECCINNLFVINSETTPKNSSQSEIDTTMNSYSNLNQLPSNNYPDSAYRLTDNEMKTAALTEHSKTTSFSMKVSKSSTTHYILNIMVFRNEAILTLFSS